MAFEIGKKLRALRKEKNLLQEDLANRTGLSQSTISAYESGEVTPSLEALEKIKAVLGEAVQTFLMDRDASKSKDYSLDKNSSSQVAEIPLLSGTVSASTFTHSFNDWEGETIGVPVKIAKNKVAWRIQGKSMEAPDGGGLSDGDVAIIDNNVRFSDGDWVVAESDSGVTVKKLVLMKDGSIELRPLNPNFPTICLKSDKKLDILGVVTHNIQDLRKRKK